MKYLLLTTICILFLACFNVDNNKTGRVDYDSFTYEMVCGEEFEATTIKIENGQYVGKMNGHEVHIQLNKVIYGDLDGDGVDEAIIQYMCGSGASGAYLGGLIHKLENNKSSFINIVGGNKANNGLTHARIENGVLIVDNAQSSQGFEVISAMKTSKFKLKDNEIVLVEPPKITTITEPNK